jgi:hypothetical protein
VKIIPANANARENEYHQGGDILLRVARGTLTVAEAQLRTAKRDPKTPLNRLMWLKYKRDCAERALRDLIKETER